jgi:hypothetical protein
MNRLRAGGCGLSARRHAGRDPPGRAGQIATTPTTPRRFQPLGPVRNRDPLQAAAAGTLLPALGPRFGALPGAVCSRDRLSAVAFAAAPRSSLLGGWELFEESRPT